MRGWKSALFVLIAYGIIEISLLAGLWALDGFGKITYDPIASELSEEQREKLTRFLERGEASSTRFDPVLGWTLDRRGRESNSAQMRDDLEYGPMPPPGKVRITAFGDSFTYGADVSLQESWAKQLVALNSSLQVLNYGVSAYGLDQAYLRYLEVADRDHPQIVFIGYMSENLARHVNVFRPFYSRSYGRTIFSKPRFRLVDGALELLDNPIATRMEHSRLLNSYSQVIDEMGVNDYHYQMGYREGGLDFLPSVRFSKILWSEIKKQALYPILTPSGLYHEESEALEVTVALLDAFYQEVLRRGALPVILIFPDGRDQHRSRNGKPPRYEPLLSRVRAREYRFFDLMQALVSVEGQYTVQDLFVKTRHYSPLGSGVVAEYLSRSLEESGLTNLVTIRESILAERKRLGIGGDAL